MRGITADDRAASLQEAGAEPEVFAAAVEMKRLAGQIDVIIHALASFCACRTSSNPVSGSNMFRSELATRAGSSTLRLIYEWPSSRLSDGEAEPRQYGRIRSSRISSCSPRSPPPSESIFIYSAHTTPLKFLWGGRALTSVLSQDDKVRQIFLERFGDRFRTIRDYYAVHGRAVQIEDVSSWLPGLAKELIGE
jgi:hypothetical protein